MCVLFALLLLVSLTWAELIDIFANRPAALKEPFSRVIQVGPPRSATTFQFTVLCASVHLKFPNASISCTFMEPTGADIEVIKAHVLTDRLVSSDRATIFFATSTNSSHSAVSSLIQPRLTQPYDVLVKIGLGVLQWYAALFDLDEDHAMRLHEYMRYWQIFRRCCGSQASVDWRMHLHGSVVEPTHKSTAYDAMDCLIYDLDRLEARMLDTSMCRDERFHKMGTRLSPMCPQRGFCNDTVQKLKDGLDFNNMPWVSPKKELHR
jgi:hypothetical protein